MTRFVDPSFSVAALPTKEYAEGYLRTFGVPLVGADCTECLGTGSSAPLSSGLQPPYIPHCDACSGTGKRAWQKPF